MLVGSILIGALAGFALLNYVRGVEAEVKQETARVSVWVVAADISSGTTATDAQRTGRLEQREIESEFRPDNAVLQLSQIEGRVAVNNLARNQVLVTGMFDDPQVIATTFSDLIQTEHVAISVNFPKNRAVAGFVKPGDFVDIIALGSAPTLGEDADAFDTSARVNSPYQRPARYLYRGVRIIAVNSEIVGQRAAVDGVLPDEEPTADASLAITFAVPAESAQRILSVNESDLILSLLPADWTPEARPNIIPDEILADAELPGERPDIVTPYGRSGFVDVLEEALDLAADDTTDSGRSLSGSSTSDDSTTTEEG